ncbi:ABC transporter ATP-binding protein [Luteococcus sp. H138]|uniref:ABC transporter ATP-binding protein n=1 Tax=unclassified Luteococcus TaxID=2639923 RepID=UPI00313B9BEE
MTIAHATAASGRQPVTVEMVDLYKQYGPTKALNGFNCTLNPGEMVVLLGPSGCGKTTALRALAGLEDIDSGRILTDGRDLTGVGPAGRDMAMVFQAYSLFPHLTARENVEFGLRVRKMGAGKRREAALRQLDLVGLADQADKYTHQMSGGQQQRVALARALAVDPTVLLLDEPLSALDAKVRVNLREEIRRLQQEAGTTALFVTHDQEEALAVADRVGVMRGGVLEQIASPTEIYGSPVTEFVAAFIGTTNRLDARSDGNTAYLLGQKVPLLPGSATGEVSVLVRPEAIDLSPATGDENAVVEQMSFLGAHTRVTAMLGDTRIVAQLGPSAALQLDVGGRVHITLHNTPALAVAA